MTQHEHELQRERIAAELAALGEEPADDAELAFAGTDEPTDDGVRDADVRDDDVRDDDVRTVATLVGLSRWQPPVEGLSALQRHRIWQRVAARAPESVADPDQPAANDGSSSGWRGVVGSLALVASVVLMFHVDMPPPPTEDDRAALESMGEATRAVLEGTLPGEQDGTRARELALGYEARLRAARGAER